MTDAIEVMRAACGAMHYWHSPEANWQGFWQIYEGGKLHSVERDEDDAADKVRELNARACIAAYRAALEANGYAVVPVEPTKGMLEAGFDWHPKRLHIELGRPPTPEEDLAGQYRAMIAAAKASPPQGDE